MNRRGFIAKALGIAAIAPLLPAVVIAVRPHGYVQYSKGFEFTSPFASLGESIYWEHDTARQILSEGWLEVEPMYEGEIYVRDKEIPRLLAKLARGEANG